MDYKRSIQFLTLITLAAAVLRIFAINTVPPGLHYDIAANAILIEEIAFENYRPSFIRSYTGKEVLFFYSAALIYQLIGSSIFSLKITATFWGIITVPITFFATKQILHHKTNVKLIAITTSMLLAFSFSHLVWSRFGLRAITQPAIQALFIGMLFKALRLGQPKLFCFAGIFAGLTFHTYLASRAMPIVLIIGSIPFLTTYIKSYKQNKNSINRILNPKNIIYMITGFSIIITPLIYHFVQFPQDLLIRIQQVGPTYGKYHLLLEGLTGSLKMLFISGEPYDRFNIPYKPLLDPLNGSMFVIGLTLTIRNIINAKQYYNDKISLHKSAELLLVIWLPVFLLPTALAINEVFPSNVRAFGLFPFLLVFPAMGYLSLTNILTSKLRYKYPAKWTNILAVTLLGIYTFTITTKDYYFIWAQQSTQFMSNHGDMVQVANTLNRKSENFDNIYVSSLHYQHPTVAYLAKDYEKIKWLRDGNTLAIPDKGSTLYVFPQSAEPPREWMDQWDIKSDDPNDKINIFEFDTSTEITHLNFQNFYTRFGQIAEIIGFRFAESSSDEINIDLKIRILDNSEENLRFVADLVDKSEHYWNQAFNDSYKSSQWTTNDIIIVRLTFDLPNGMPPGNYVLSTNIYSPDTNKTIGATDKNGNVTNTAQIGPIFIQGTSKNNIVPVPSQIISHNFGNLYLFGFDLPKTSFVAGESIPLSLYWRAKNKIDHNKTINVSINNHNIDSTEPVQGNYNTSLWSVNENIIDHRSIKIPKNMKSGEYNLKINSTTDNNKNSHTTISTINIVSTNRIWTTPFAEQKTNFTFGNMLQMVGYNINYDETPQIDIELHWKCIRETNSNYKIFIHAYNEDGTLVTQNDSQPIQNTYPTSLWIPDEYVLDTHTLTLESGKYDLEIGLYIPDTGERLLLSEGENHIEISNIKIPQ